MIHGVLIAESLRCETTLDGLNLMVRKLERLRPSNTTADQAQVWTLLHFQAEDADAEELSAALADALDAPGWYADFYSDAESFVIFPGRVFRYARGDGLGRSAAANHGRTLGIPESQLDWPS